MENFESKLKKLKDLYELSNKEVECIEKIIFDGKNNVKNNIDAEASLNYLYKRGVRDALRACIEIIEEGENSNG